MGTPITIKGEIAKELLVRFPKAKTKSLAIKAYKENPSIFKDSEDARTCLRYHSGKLGKVSRIKADTSLHRPLNINLPEGDKPLDWTPIQLDVKNALILSDIHVPYHDRDAIMRALEYGVEKGMDSIYLNGDLCDFYQLSRWIRDPRMRDFAQEINMMRTFLKSLRDSFPELPIWYKRGNHEERYDNYMKLKAPELMDVDDFQLERVLRLKEFDMQVVNNLQYVTIGQLPIMHGHEFGSRAYSPVNAARGFFLKGIESMLAGHSHQASSHTTKTLSDKVIGVWSTGCLCDLHPPYMPKNNHTHGFAMVEVIDEHGRYLVDNKRIHDGIIYNV